MKKTISHHALSENCKWNYHTGADRFSGCSLQPTPKAEKIPCKEDICPIFASEYAWERVPKARDTLKKLGLKIKRIYLGEKEAEKMVPAFDNGPQGTTFVEGIEVVVSEEHAHFFAIEIEGL